MKRYSFVLILIMANTVFDQVDAQMLAPAMSVGNAPVTAAPATAASDGEVQTLSSHVRNVEGVGKPEGGGGPGRTLDSVPLKNVDR